MKHGRIFVVKLGAVIQPLGLCSFSSPTHPRRSTHCLPTQDLNPAYNMLLRSELLGCQCPSPISPDKATQLEQMRGASSPSKKILRFKSGGVWGAFGG